MTKEEALYNFFSQFGIKAFREEAVPSGASKPTFPYITYQTSSGSIGEDISIVASRWDQVGNNYSAGRKNDEWADEVSRILGKGGKLIPFDGGALWMKKGTPFSLSMGDPADPLIRRKLITLSIENLTEY